MTGIDLATTPLEAGWETRAGVLRVQLWPLGQAAPVELVFAGALATDDQRALAENLSRRLNRDLLSLPPR